MTLTAEQLSQFRNDGALVVRGVLGEDWLAQVRAEFGGRVDDLLARYGLAGDGDFCAKVSRLLANRPDAYEHLDISLPMLDDMAGRVSAWREVWGADWKSQAGVFAPPSVYGLLTHPAVVGIARQIVGGGLCASPVQHVRIKPPQRILSKAAAGDANMARTMWHQDEAVVGENARGVDILTVWVAATAATVENGCMYYVAGSHLVADDDGLADFGLTTHCPGKELVGEIYIPDGKLDKAKMRPLVAAAGDVVLLHRRTIHGAGANDSDGLRWSFDLRFQRVGLATGRECFPSLVVDDDGDGGGADGYREAWLRARDRIISGEVAAVFNHRWNKYQGAQVCA